MITFKLVLALFTVLIFWCFIIWCVLGAIMFAMVSFGNIERIVFIDKQLARNLDKYYDEQGYMKWNYQMSYAIGTRLMCYWLAYPFIRHRVTTKSKKFRLFMWVNCIGSWIFVIASCFSLLVEWLETIG
ncbi:MULTISPECIES: hypothetical protein [unclassified Vibrio]|uniref:hypothetical protein n=1 Tax=unclassified Vibrio TaxID=2614977 RepID=UPI002F4173F0